MLEPGFILFVSVLIGAYVGFLEFVVFKCAILLFILSAFFALFFPSRPARAILLLFCTGFFSTILAHYQLFEFRSRESRMAQVEEFFEGVVEESLSMFLRGKRLQVRADLGFRVIVSLKDGAALVPIKSGDRVRIFGQIKHLQHAMAPGEFDSYWFGVARHFEGRVSIHSPFRIQILSKRSESFFWSEIREKLRNHWIEVLNPREASVLLALTLGDTAFFETEQKEIYQWVGAGHLLAVSGLQIGCLSFLFFYFFRFILLLFPYIGRRSLARIPAVFLTLFSIWGFVFLSGSSASALRSALMSSVVLLGYAWNRSSSLINSFGIAGFLTVLLAPESILDPSFTLSYVAILGVLLGASLGAGILVLPLCAYYFGALALGGILVNLILVPIAVFLQSPAIFLAVLGLARPGAYLAGMIESICEALGDWLGGYWVISPPSWQMTVGFLAVVILFLTERKKWSLSLWVLLLGILYWPEPQGLHITVLPVGQGDASIFEFPNGQVMLIDGGPREEYLLNYLKQKKIKHVDILALSHPDADHIMGFFKVMEELEVREIWHSGFEENHILMKRFLDLAENKHISVKAAKELLEDHTFGEAKVVVLAPKNFIKEESTNNNSLVLQIVLGQNRALWAGDIEANIEKQATDQWSSELLKVPHHGSRTSSSEYFVRKIAPQQVIFCTQAENQFGFPHKEIKKRWEEASAQIWDTGELGKIDIILTGHKIIFQSFLKKRS